MKVYAGCGEGKETELYGGKKISKTSYRVQAYGTVDELSSVLGVADSHLEHADLKDAIKKVQNELHIICAELSSEGEGGHRITEGHVKSVQDIANKYDEENDKLTKFVLPGGSKAATFLHVARTVARRAEREVIKLAEKESVNEHIIGYLNRLSDLMFVMARVVNKREDFTEVNPTY